MPLGNIWLWFSCFSISSDIAESPKIIVVPFLHSSLFCCTALLSALLVFSVGAVWISFLVLTCSSECFAVCSTSITAQFLVFELWGNSCFESLSITASKYTPDCLLEKPSIALLLTSVLSSQIIGEEFFLLLNSVSVESSLNGVVLIWNSFFRVDAAKSSSITSLLFGISVVLITLFSDVLQLFIEVVDKLFESSSVFLVIIIIIFYVKQYHFLLDHWHIYTRGFHH